MNEYYYTPDPSCGHNEKLHEIEALGVKASVYTDSGVFSRDGLDYGTELLIKSLTDVKGDFLDLGCGWGAVGIVVAKAFPDSRVTMSDINSRAVEYAEKNCRVNNVANARVVRSDGLADVEGGFDTIAVNPPIRAGKQVVYSLFSQSYDRLRQHGRLYVVIRKQQGAESAQKFLAELFGNATRIYRDKGYWIILCEKGETNEG